MLACQPVRPQPPPLLYSQSRQLNIFDSRLCDSAPTAVLLGLMLGCFPVCMCPLVLCQQQNPTPSPMPPSMPPGSPSTSVCYACSSAHIPSPLLVPADQGTGALHLERPPPKSGPCRYWQREGNHAHNNPLSKTNKLSL